MFGKWRWNEEGDSVYFVGLLCQPPPPAMIDIRPHSCPQIGIELPDNCRVLTP